MDDQMYARPPVLALLSDFNGVIGADTPAFGAIAVTALLSWHGFALPGLAANYPRTSRTPGRPVSKEAVMEQPPMALRMCPQEAASSPGEQHDN